MIRLEADTPGYRFVSWDDVAIVAWLKAPTKDASISMYSFLTSLASERKKNIYVFVVIGVFADLPDGEARTTMSESMAKTASFTTHVISVIEGEGFRAAAIRSIASAMQLLARKTAPMKVFSTVNEAIDWTIKQKGVGSVIEREEFTRAVRMARTGS